MVDPKIDFEQVKALLLNEKPEDLANFIRSTKFQLEAMFLFWALDYLDHHPKEIPMKSKQVLEKNREILNQGKAIIFTESLESSLKEFSPGFILGTLEFSIREREAQISRYQEYVELLAKIQAWPELGFPDEQFKKHWEERINDIKEIQDWLKTRAKDWYPVIISVYRSGNFHKSPNKALKALRKGRKDNTVFQILAALLHSNPILDRQIKDFCKKNQIVLVEKAQLMKILNLLAQETADTKVRELCQLLLNAKKKEEMIN
ncbi:MAG: hypothetical protein ACFFB5_04215 [Promethearchaeota archaeon]